MTTVNSIKFYFIIIGFTVLTFSCSKKEEVVKKPNFLFVLVDDQPFDALESSGRYPFLKTPNLIIIM